MHAVLFVTVGQVTIPYNFYNGLFVKFTIIVTGKFYYVNVCQKQHQRYQNNLKKINIPQFANIRDLGPILTALHDM